MKNDTFSVYENTLALEEYTSLSYAACSFLARAADLADDMKRISYGDAQQIQAKWFQAAENPVSFDTLFASLDTLRDTLLVFVSTHPHLTNAEQVAQDWQDAADAEDPADE